MRLLSSSAVLLSLMAFSRPARAGEIVLRNGDHITGKIVSLVAGELEVASDGAGKLTIDVKQLKTFSSDEPLTIQLGTGPSFPSRVGAGPDGKVELQRSLNAAPELVAIVDIIAINPPPPAWTGEVSLNGEITRGSSRRTEAGIELTLDKEWPADRLHFTGEYLYGRERSDETGVTSTTEDFADVYGKYGHDLHDKLYAHVNAKLVHDALAELKYRVSPAIGLGYRWLDTPSLELFTDLGVAYNDERFSSSGGRSFWGPQVEYGIEWSPVSPLRLSHTLEYYPSFSDVSGNYLLDTHAVIHVTIATHMFVELRGEYHHDTEPAPSATRGQFRLLLGPGWER